MAEAPTAGQAKPASPGGPGGPKRPENWHSLSVAETAHTVAADLACNGADFQFIDFNQNCQLTGPCTKESIGKLLRVNLEPDDFLLLAIGQAPLIPNPTGTVRWDAKAAQEILELHSEDRQWKQTIVLDGREQRWDVLSSTVWNPVVSMGWLVSSACQPRGTCGR